MGNAQEMKINYSFHPRADLLLKEGGAHSPGNSRCLEYNLSKFHHFPSFLAYELYIFKESDLMVNSQIVA